MVWVVSRFRLKAPPGISSSCISPLTSSGQRSRASCASQPQKSATLSPQPGGKPRKFIRTCGGIGGGGDLFIERDYNDLWAKLIEFTNFGEEKAHRVSGAVEFMRRRTYTPRQSRLKPIAICAAVWGPTVRGWYEKAGCVSELMSDTLLCITVSA